MTNATELANLFNPQVVGDMIDKKLTDYVKFAPLATINTNLVGRPGDTLTLPFYSYIGNAVAVPEGTDIPIGQLVESTTTVAVTKVGKGVQITDEALLSGYGDPAGEAVKQLTLSIASKIDNDMLTTLEGIGSGMTYAATGTSLVADDVADALILFGEDIEDGLGKVILVSPDQYGAFRKADDWVPASELSAAMIIDGTAGMIHGCQVVVSNKLAGKKEAFIVKPNALNIIMKRNAMVETDRDIINKSFIMTADQHCACYLYDSSKAIKITHQ